MFAYFSISCGVISKFAYLKGYTIVVVLLSQNQDMIGVNIAEPF